MQRWSGGDCDGYSEEIGIPNHPWDYVSESHYTSRMTSEQSKLQTILGILLALAPVIFVWTMELLVTSEELTDSGLVFFIWEIPPLAAYHATMYVMFLVSWIGAFNITHHGLSKSE